MALPTACIVGIAIGYFMGMHRWFDEVMDPWIATLYSIPIITVVPLIIIWFGIGMISESDRRLQNHRWWRSF